MFVRTRNGTPRDRPGPSRPVRAGSRRRRDRPTAQMTGFTTIRKTIVTMPSPIAMPPRWMRLTRAFSSGGGPLEIQYLNMLGAHSSYWTSPDFIRMLVTEVGRRPGKLNALPNMRAVKKTQK